MELKDFIKESLVQIASGIEEAQKDLKEAGSDAVINTNITKIEGGLLATGGRRKSVEYVEFDVAVLANDESGAKAGVGITVASIFKAEGGAETTTSRGTESRIKFKVPMTYPMHTYDKPEE